MKRLFLLSVLILLSAAIFASVDFYEIGLTAIKSTDSDIMGPGISVSYSALADTSNSTAFGLNVHLDAGLLLSPHPYKSKTYILNETLGAALTPIQDFCFADRFDLLLSVGPSLYLETHNDEDILGFGLYGDAKIFFNLADGLGIGVGAQCYLNLISLYDDYLTTDKTFAPGGYISIIVKESSWDSLLNY